MNNEKYVDGFGMIEVVMKSDLSNALKLKAIQKKIDDPEGEHRKLATAVEDIKTK